MTKQIENNPQSTANIADDRVLAARRFLIQNFSNINIKKQSYETKTIKKNAR